MLPLALAVIVCATAIPIELAPAAPPTLTAGLLDWLVNVVLYVPLGLALGRRPPHRGFRATKPWAVFAVGALLSTGVEILQIWFVGRQPSLPDVVANTLGTVLGATLAGLMPMGSAGLQQQREIGSWPPGRLASLPFVFVGTGTALAAAGGVLVISAVLVWRAYPADLSNWDRSYDVLLGNEVTADRPWRGVVSALALVPGALTRAEARVVAAPGDRPRAPLFVSADGWLVDTPVRLQGEAVRITDRLDPRLLRAIVDRNAFTVVVRGATADVTQRGPARLVTASRDQFHRNFDVGQQGRAVRFRVRTPAAGLNGDIYAETGDVLENDRPTTIVASYDGDIARIFVDGRLEARTNLSAAACLVYAACDADVPLMAGLLGGCLGLCALPFFGRTGRGLMVMALAATCVAALLAYVGDAAGTVPAFQHWFAPTAGAGAGAVASAARWGRGTVEG